MVVSFRVFKKASPNNKVTIYLGRRDFIDHVTESDPIDGVLLIDKEYLQGRQVNAVQCWTEGRSSTAVAEGFRPRATATVAEV